MTSLSLLSNSQLLEKTKSLALEERKVMREVLEHLEEIDRRKLFAAEGFSSLYDYAEKVLGYSTHEAYSRIASMRLLKQLPQAKQELANGELSLSTLTLAHTLFRKDKTQFDSKEKKSALLKDFKGKSKRECEKIVAKLAPQTLIHEKERQVTEELTELRIPITAELLQKLKLLQEKLGKHSYCELLELFANEALKKVEAQEKKQSAKMGLQNSPGGKMPDPNKRFIPAQIKREVKSRDAGQCTFVHPKTKQRCEAKRYLQFDHYPKPWSAGGETSVENLRLLCFAHHQLATLETFGRRTRNIWA